jgi:allophanate hydrolase
MKPPVWISTIPDHEVPAGPLSGMRFAIKDNIDYAGVPTTAGCPAYAYTPSQSAPIVERLEAAGARAVGKTNLDQFATGLVGVRSPYGACASIYNEEYISGGSSSGSAVAVASGQVDFALGTDTAGSGRVPAAFNNIVGLKPSRGLIPNDGVVPACRSLDCVSLFTRDVDTAASVFQCIHPREATEAWGRGPFRFGVLPREQREFFGDDEAAALYQQFLERLESAGGESFEIDYDPFREAASLLYAGPWVAERYAAVGQFIESHPDATHPVVRDIVLGAKKYSAAAAYEAAYKLDALRERCDEAWGPVDVYVLPTTGTIYKIKEVEADPVRLNSNLGYYTNFVNLLDLAAMAIPAGFRRGLPFGVSLIAPAGSDWELLDLAARLQQVRVVVVGAHLRGQPLNRQLTERGGRFIRQCKTTPEYRLFSLRHAQPPKPGLLREPGFAGPGIEVEVWSIPTEKFGSFVALIPPPLGIGTIALEDGTSELGFICEPAGLQGSEEITPFGGWRAWRAQAASK